MSELFDQIISQLLSCVKNDETQLLFHNDEYLPYDAHNLVDINDMRSEFVKALQLHGTEILNLKNSISEAHRLGLHSEDIEEKYNDLLLATIRTINIIDIVEHDDLMYFIEQVVDYLTTEELNRNMIVLPNVVI